MIFYANRQHLTSNLAYLSAPHLDYVGKMNADEYRLAHRLSHSHDFLEVLLTVDGSGTITTTNHTFKIKKGDLLIYNSGLIHDESSKDLNICIYYIGVNNLCWPQLSPNHMTEDNALPLIHLGDDFDFVYAIFDRIYILMQNNTPDNEQVANYLVGALLAYYRHKILRLDKSLKIDTSKNTSIYDAVKNYIEDNYLNEISLEIISQAVSVSPFHMSRVFKEKAGYSPMQYVTRLRLGKAQTLLVHTDMAVTDIAGEVGYNSSSAFNYSFQKQFGMSPLTFRDLYR